MRQYSGLLTDLYELTMAAGYWQTGFDGRATFELFARHLPPHRNYLIAAGLEQALSYLEQVSFDKEEIAYLRRHPMFGHIRAGFFDYLERFRFTGDAWAMPEGTVAFAGEPMMRITAPIIEAQIVETYLLATLSYQTMVASKASRLVTAAQGRQVVDFGSRRAHGSGAALLAARAAAVGGSVGTSNVLAGKLFGIKTYGTQAHSWVMAHESEAASFESFMNVFPEGAVLLLDTYDVRNATKQIIVAGRRPAGLRLDSGDLVRDSQWVRRELDKAGWPDVSVFASGDLDEYKIAKLIAEKAAINAFGVGTALAAPGDAPHVSMIYKLVEVERAGKIREAAKLTQTKATFPGRKQVLRYSKASGEFSEDRIVLQEEPPNRATPLLREAMREGRRVQPAEPIATMRERCIDGVAKLPARHRRIDKTVEYPVRYSTRLRALLEKVRKRIHGSATRTKR
jgi:nicotinate phosphoribosyltransferase